MFQGEPPVYRNKNWCRALPLPCSKAFFIFIFIKAVENIANFILSVVKKMSFCSTPNEVCFGGDVTGRLGFYELLLTSADRGTAEGKLAKGGCFSPVFLTPVLRSAKWCGEIQLMYLQERRGRT